ncbi:MAG: UbiA prenyltransferase family protein [Candidatus Peribacteraceae bacterium]|nr:UbiA prenyltransferase family protein [Candidatus Peribacteraceae bacterium]
MIKKILFNSVTVSLPKNIVQFALSAILYWVIIGNPDITTLLVALSGFLISYSAVYMYNDLVDYEEDKKDSEKLRWKLLASGDMSFKQAKIITLTFLVVGFGISFFVNRWFFAMVAGMIALNFLHSSPYTRYKKSMNKTSINMTVIEFLKFSCAWFALTTDITRFPFWILLTFAIAYNVSYIIYKFDFKGKTIKTNKKIIGGLGITGLTSYMISFIYYGMPISMIFLIVIPLFIILLFKQMDIKFHKIDNMLITEYMLLPVVILSFLILTIPAVGLLNSQMADTIDVYTDVIVEEIPDAITGHVDNLTDKLKEYETLEDIENKIKEDIENITELKPI